MYLKLTLLENWTKVAKKAMPPSVQLVHGTKAQPRSGKGLAEAGQRIRRLAAWTVAAGLGCFLVHLALRLLIAGPGRTPMCQPAPPGFNTVFCGRDLMAVVGNETRSLGWKRDGKGARRVLVLGLGGGAIPHLLTAADSFDVVLMDAFKGADPSAPMQSAAAASDVYTLLRGGGLYAINVFTVGNDGHVEGALDTLEGVFGQGNVGSEVVMRGGDAASVLVYGRKPSVKGL
ncbi:hypothetical protein WJX72_002724 [[Myrmecia] bisecta]|uniref:Methyltransferase type 11 domain-containing protein n=1 Tax=[Myrmecia] bisecta TaxID=41462 RepID=A0AAW1QPI1_9CHLO